MICVLLSCWNSFGGIAFYSNFPEKTKAFAACQIDLLIQTKFNCIYPCEIKFSKSEINATVIDEMQQKIQRLKIPKVFLIAF